MKFKRKVYEHSLRDLDLTIYLHSPSIEDFDDYLNRLQSISVVGNLITAFTDKTTGKVVIPAEDKENVKALICMTASIKDDNGQLRPIEMDEAAQFSMLDALSVATAINTLAEKKQENPTQAGAAPQATEQPA